MNTTVKILGVPTNDDPDICPDFTLGIPKANDAVIALDELTALVAHDAVPKNDPVALPFRKLELIELLDQDAVISYVEPVNSVVPLPPADVIAKEAVKA